MLGTVRKICKVRMEKVIKRRIKNKTENVIGYF